MELYQGIILGIIQGLTEFLPVSSSAHLVFGQHIFGLNEPEMFFNISVHIGTLFAVFIVFFDSIKQMIVNSFSFIYLFIKKQKSFMDIEDYPDVKIVFLIIIGSFPTAVLGIAFNKIADELFSSIFVVGLMLIVTGSFLWSTKKIIDKKDNKIESFSVKQALIIGLVQGLAIIPGISRSGSTIVAGLYLGLTRETAARYSFLLSIPAIVGAELLYLKDLVLVDSINNIVTLTATLISFIVGYCALKILLKMVKQGRLYLFAPYCWFVGIIVIISAYL